MALLYRMSGAIPVTTGGFNHYRPDGEEESDMGRASLEFNISNNYGKPSGCNECNKPRTASRSISFAPENDQVHNLDSAPPSPELPPSSPPSKFSSIKKHTRKISGLTVFQRRQGSKKPRLGIDTNVALTPSKEGRCHSCPTAGAPCNCFLERYVAYSSSARSIDLPDSISPAVTELAEMARQQHIACLKRHQFARSESDSPNGLERKRQAIRVKQAWEEQEIERRYQMYVETQRKIQATGIHDIALRYHMVQQRNEATEAQQHFSAMFLENYEFGGPSKPTEDRFPELPHDENEGPVGRRTRSSTDTSPKALATSSSEIAVENFLEKLVTAGDVIRTVSCSEEMLVKEIRLAMDTPIGSIDMSEPDRDEIEIESGSFSLGNEVQWI